MWAIPGTPGALVIVPSPAAVNDPPLVPSSSVVFAPSVTVPVLDQLPPSRSVPPETLIVPLLVQLFWSVTVPADDVIDPLLTKFGALTNSPNVPVLMILPAFAPALPANWTAPCP